MATSTRTQPEVSVVVTLYNGSALIGETMRSLLSQTLTDIEIIVVDDASPDGGAGLAICQSFADHRVRILRNEVNLGVGGARNRGLDEARGQFIAMSDQDDLSEPGRLAISAARLSEEPSLGAGATAAYSLENGRRRKHYRGGIPWWILGWRLFSWFSIVHSSICYRRATLLAHGLQYEDQYRYADDFVMLGRLSAVSRIEVLPDYLVTYREHEAAASVSQAGVMADSGARWIADQLRARLGLEVAESTAKAYWSMIGEGIAPASEWSLRECGELFWTVFDAYCRSIELTASRRRQLTAEASERWWACVLRFCKKHGRSDAVRLFNSASLLPAGAAPSRRKRIAGALGLRTRRYIRGGL
ncbi:MAG TPA: glycosyltransferase family 2 protein [Gammaproteobacteria bacterium]|nr:glycosyltransferase family 2 protein [Gammaproteobacteria bacterium]